MRFAAATIASCVAVANSQSVDWLSRIANANSAPAAPQPPVASAGQQPPAAAPVQDPNELLKSLQKLQAQWAAQTQPAGGAPHPTYAQVPPTQYTTPQGTPSYAQVPPAPQQYQSYAAVPTAAPTQPVVEQPVEDLEAASDDVMDLSCSPRWQEMKRIMLSVFTEPAATIMTISPADIETLLQATASTMPSDLLTTTNECGLARLMVQMLSFIKKMGDANSSPSAVDNELLATEPLHSPMMTVLLDLPWVDTVNSAWPYFQLLAQWNLRNRQEGRLEIARDVMSDPLLQQFHGAVMAALDSGDFNLLTQASAAFLQHAGGDDQAVLKPMAFLTAMAGLSIGLDPIEKATMFQNMQNVLATAVQTPSDLSYILNSAWPVFSIVSLALLS